MFDGLKIFVENADFGGLMNSPELEFFSMVSHQTGELKPGEPRRAEHRGLLFKLKPSGKNPAVWHLEVTGSLHRFFKDGEPNTGSFTHAEVCEAIAELCRLIRCTPAAARVQNLEFCANVRLPVPVGQYLKSLVCMGGQPFAEMNAEKTMLGKVVSRQQYSVKFYDKGRQTATAERDLLRVEVHVSKMKFLEWSGIETLADLLDPAKVEPLGDVLAKAVRETVAYDGSIDPRQLTERERLRLKDFQNPIWWGDLSRDGRWQWREKMAEMLARFGANNLQLSVVDLVKKEWQNLLGEPVKTSVKTPSVFGAPPPISVFGAEKKNRRFNR